MTERYSRHNLIDWFSRETLARTKSIVIGAGAVGNEVIKNLALLGSARSASSILTRSKSTILHVAFCLESKISDALRRKWPQSEPQGWMVMHPSGAHTEISGTI